LTRPVYNIKKEKKMEVKIILVNEDGEEVEFFIDEQFEFEDNLYVVC
jgi:hypothetical protein